MQKQPPEVFYKKVFLKILQNSQKHMCQSLFLTKLKFYKKRDSDKGVFL